MRGSKRMHQSFLPFLPSLGAEDRMALRRKMRDFRKIAIGIGVALFVVCLWVWWNRPRPIDVATRVPSEALVYAEANDLPRLLESLTAVEPWRAILGAGARRSSLWGRALAWIGAGRARDVVLARAQVAFIVLDLEADGGTEALNVKPSAALIAETHTSEWRTRSAVEDLVGELARRVYGTPSVERNDGEDGLTITWTAPTGNRRLIANVVGSTVIVGNDEQTVQACIAVRRKEHRSLAEEARFDAMRRRFTDPATLAFGYVSPRGATEIAKILALTYAARMSDDPRAQSAAAIILPQLAGKILRDATWSMRVADGRIEDEYLFALPDELASRIAPSFSPSPEPIHSAERLLPAGTHQLTRYNYEDPAAAWEGMKSAIASQLDRLIEPLAGRVLDAALKPYGIESPRDFLRAAGPEIATAQILADDETRLLVARVKDETALRAEVRRHLRSFRREALGDVELLVSTDEARGAACFVDGYLILGRAEDVRQCVRARAAARIMADDEAFRRAAGDAGQALIATYTREREAAREMAHALGRDDLAAPSAYALATTTLTEEGFRRRVRSSLGLLGAVLTQIAPATR